jgi:hypothetical protein
MLAGSKDRKGYVIIRVDNNVYKAHRLAWLYVYGEWPDGEIDHINRNKSDNRIENLRVVTRSQNQMNIAAYSNNSAGIKGVVWHEGRQHWRAYIKIDGQLIDLGHFSDIDDAKQARLEAETELFGKFAPGNVDLSDSYGGDIDPDIDPDEWRAGL